ncbi:MAG: tetratricopeptide repeat protein [Nitrospinae bacterium]|nr:tetratricopeptide repeat protein [Nitrospinota bacterium]
MAVGALEVEKANAGQLDSFKGDAIRLFIRDATLRQQMQTMLEKNIGFTNVSAITTGQNQTENVERLCKVLMTEEVHVLLGQPPSPGKESRATTKLEILSDFLLNVQTRIKQAGKDKEKIDKCMSKIIPLVEEAENYQMRMKYVSMVAEFHIPSAFIFNFPTSVQPQEQIKERAPILLEFLTDHFTGKEVRLKEIADGKEEAAMSVKKEQAEKMLRQGEDYRKTGNFEEAVQCFNKAIELMPSNTDAYIESGKTYTKLKKYPRAITRFVEAEEISAQLPTANQEIAATRIVQVKEMVAQGMDVDSPEIKKLLDEASKNFKTALKKASELKPLHQDDKVDRSAEAISKVAGAMFKMELGETLGARNPIAKEISALARESLQSAVKGEDTDNLPASQMICLALADVDKGEFDAAEKLLLKAAVDKKYFSEAYRELNYMGTQIRIRVGVDQAMILYRKLLTADPPNKGAIHYNISVAMHASGNKLEAAGSIVQAVYTDPSLPNDDLFSRNKDIVELMAHLVSLFAKAAESKMKPTPKPQTGAAVDFSAPSDPKFAAYCAKFEELIRQDREKAFRVLYDISKKLPDFFKSTDAYSNTPLMELMADARVKFDGKPVLAEFVDFLKKTLEEEEKIFIAPGPEHEILRENCERLSEADFNAAVKEFYGIYTKSRGFFATPAALESDKLVQFVGKVREKFLGAGNPRLKNFTEFLALIGKKAEALRGMKTAASNPTLKKLADLAGSDKSAALDFAGELFETNPGFFELSEVYESALICDFAEKTTSNPPAGADAKKTEAVRRLSGFLSSREKYLTFTQYSQEALNVLMETADQRKMANCIAKAIYSMPECVEKPFFYEHGDIVSATKEIYMKLRGLANQGI